MIVEASPERRRGPQQLWEVLVTSTSIFYRR
jgi:hypothetical protein